MGKVIGENWSNINGDSEYGLTYSDLIRHGNPCGEGVCFNRVRHDLYPRQWDSINRNSVGTFYMCSRRMTHSNYVFAW